MCLYSLVVKQKQATWLWFPNQYTYIHIHTHTHTHTVVHSSYETSTMSSIIVKYWQQGRGQRRKSLFYVAFLFSISLLSSFQKWLFHIPVKKTRWWWWWWRRNHRDKEEQFGGAKKIIRTKRCIFTFNIDT